ncbi:putative Guanine-nucleotide-exchange-factor [Fasciola hepatica]|uniref:Guanine-nucleotide-exchange-factor n=1 Tax=Fasciola hepatica TaxID=6192 RepID=A0A4E0RUY2_FASHE|nr:putative Guanine-nucleotide-exchange-factor [Fasciola hepatica]
MNQTLLSGIEWKNHSAIPMFEDFSTEKTTLNRQKKYLLEELISSEIKYISYLKKILKYFAEPLSNSVLLPPDMHAEIFGRLSPILCVNETLLESVLTMGIEEAFLIIAPCLKLYADYARRYQTTIVLLETCITFNTGLSQFMYEQENLPDVNLQLPALLIMPIQRIPRYSLLVQEILAVYLQLDGFTAEEANRSVNQVVTLSQQPQAIPEQVSAWILTRYCNITAAATPASVNSPGSAFHVATDWDSVDQLASRASLPTIRLMAAFAGITATANYLNEQIRLNDQSDKAALLQSKLLGRWTRNLLLVPGRRLLRYGLVYKINELNGRRQPRLFVLLSDILIYATPQKRRHLRSGLSGLREKRKQARSIPRRGCRLQNVGRAETGQTSLYRPGNNHSVWFRRRLRHGFAYPPFERAWLDTVARPHPNQVHECPVDLLASRNVRFTCISVYPLHHCQIAPHFTIDSRPADFVERSHSHFMFIDEKAVGRSPEYRTHLTFSANMEDTLLNRTGTAFTGRARDSVCPNTPVSFDLGCLSQERNAFTVTCRDVSFTVDFDDRSTAEHWVVSLDTAISAVRMARQSLRKASSAKRPMPVADFVSYEQWLWRTDHQTHKPSNPPLSRISTLTESLGLHERNGLCNWLDSGRRLFHTCRRLTSPFSNLRDSGKVYVAETSDEIPRTGLSCLRSKSCVPLNYCISNEVRSEFFQSAFKENSVRLVGVHSQDTESVMAPAPQWSKISFTSFDDCSPTFASLSVSVAAGSPQHSSPLSHCQLGPLDSSGIASGCSTDTPTYASVVDVSSEPVIASPCNQCRNSGSSRCSLM